MQGQAFFRSAVIEALGDYQATYALGRSPRSPSSTVRCRTMRRWRSARSATRRRCRCWPAAADRAARVAAGIAAAICLLGVNCGSHQPYLAESLRFAIAKIGFQELLRVGVGARGAGRRRPRGRARELIEQGAPTRDPARAPIALALGTVALRNTPLMLKVLERRSRCANRASSCCARRSTCSRRISRRSASS